MKFASIRDLRNRPGLLQGALREEPVTLTSNGRPFALIVGLEAEEDPAELERLIRQARAQRAVSRIRERARREGEPTEGAVEEEIRAARAERRG
jgi:prevent-host-death family protein